MEPLRRTSFKTRCAKVGVGTKKIVLDLGGVERIDSCGIGILASLMWSASQAGGGMVLASVPKQVEKLLGIVILLDHHDHHRPTAIPPIAMLNELNVPRRPPPSA